MLHRERLLLALDHHEPDRMPIDLGGALACSINIDTYEGLKRRLGLTSPTAVLHRVSQVAVVDEEVLQRFDVDVRGLRPGRAGGDAASWADAWDDYIDEWGVRWAKPAYHHARDMGSPLSHDGVTTADLLRYSWPDPENPALVEGLRERALRLRSATDCALVFALSLYPFDQCHLLRGFGGWLMDLVTDRSFAESLLDAVTDVLVATLDRLLATVGDLVDVVCWGDDLSSQRGPLMRPALYAELVKPRHRRMMDAFRRGTRAKVFFHTDGSVRWLLPHLIDLGIDVANPLQVGAEGMDPAGIKRDFGKDICFWGGGCDSQHTLPFATPEQIREEVRRRIADLAPGGGWVFAPIHHIEAGVPPENVEAMYEAALEFGRGPYQLPYSYTKEASLAT